MSKCECCKEENSDLITYKGYKMCPACYMGYVRKVKVCENNAKYETEIDQLKQQLKEYKNKENTFAVNSWDEMLKNCENCGLNECIGCEYTQTCVQNIKQQLVEKDKEIKKLNWQLKDKDFIIKNLNHSLSVAPNANAGQRARIDELTKIVKEKDKRIAELEQELAELKEKDNYHLRYELAGADETITNLKKQIEENGKEINTKNNKLAELKKELTICKDTLRRKTQSNRDLQHRVHNVNTQLAIQELEKVKNFVDGRTYCADYIKKRIKELKGE